MLKIKKGCRTNKLVGSPFLLKAVGEGVSAYGVEVNLSAVIIAYQKNKDGKIEKQLPYITGVDSCFVFIDNRQPENR